jgi:hypothetical protein
VAVESQRGPAASAASPGACVRHGAACQGTDPFLRAEWSWCPRFESGYEQVVHVAMTILFVLQTLTSFGNSQRGLEG